MPHAPSIQAPAPRRRSGLTLIELMLALAVTAVIGAAIAAMLGAVSRGVASSQDVRSMVTRHKVLEARLAASIRGSGSVLFASTDRLVLWAGDTNPDGQPNLSEIRRIERDAQGHLWSYRASFPAGWSAVQIAAADVAYPLASDFDAVTSALKTDSLFPGEKWMTGISALGFTLNKSPAQSATLVSYRATLVAGDQSSVAIGAAAMRN